MLTVEEVLARLKILRESRNIRQEDLACQIGVDRTTYVKKEKGQVPITTEEWLKIADVMDVDPGYFFIFSKPAHKKKQV